MLINVLEIKQILLKHWLQCKAAIGFFFSFVEAYVLHLSTVSYAFMNSNVQILPHIQSFTIL